MTEDRAYTILTALRNIKLSISDEMNEQLKPWFDDIEKAIEDEQMPEVTSTMQTGQFDYVPIRETKGISCTECKYFKITQEPLRDMGGLIDLGQARCEKHDLIKDFAHHGQFKNLKPCEYYEDFKEGDEE